MKAETQTIKRAIVQMKNETLVQDMRWMKLGNIVLMEGSQSRKTTCVGFHL